MRSRWCCQKSGRPVGGTRSRAGGSRRRQAERAARLWADRNEPRERAVPTKRTERSGLACSFTGVGRGAARLWVSTIASHAAAGEVDGESQAGVPAVSGGRVGHAAAQGQAISRRSPSAVGGTGTDEPDVDDGFHAG